MPRSTYGVVLAIGVLTCLARPTRAEATLTPAIGYSGDRVPITSPSAGPTQGAISAGSRLLKITSPADGTVVDPGQTVTVVVSSTETSTFSSVTVIAEDALRIAPVATKLPARFPIAIPANISCRKYILTALDVTTAGVRSTASIRIDVERPDLPISLAPEMRQIIFDAEGETGRIDLVAGFRDGVRLDVRESSRVRYQSSDSTVATVDAAGVVTAVAEGDADITAHTECRRME